MTTETTIVTPRRIQRKRTKGWRLPSNTVCVSRPSKWGNPFRVIYDRVTKTWGVFHDGEMCVGNDSYPTKHQAMSCAVAMFCGYYSVPFLHHDVQSSLRGKNLACWCPPGMPCHTDVLLAIANADEGMSFDDAFAALRAANAPAGETPAASVAGEGGEAA